MLRKIILPAAFLIFTLVANKSVGAYMYGQEEQKMQILVNKQVKSPLESNWHDSLSSNEETFAPSDFVEFRITVKNIGDQDLTNIRLVDYLPDNITSVFDPGDYDQANKQIKWNFDRLTPNEEREFLIKTEINSADKLPSNETFCLVNRINVDTDQGKSDSATTHFCVNPKILAAKLPKAGFPLWLSTIIGMAFLGTGFIARKFGRGEILN